MGIAVIQMAVTPVILTITFVSLPAILMNAKPATVTVIARFATVIRTSNAVTVHAMTLLRRSAAPIQEVVIYATMTKAAVTDPAITPLRRNAAVMTKLVTYAAMTKPVVTVLVAQLARPAVTVLAMIHLVVAVVLGIPL